MGKASRDKGKRGEREAAALLRDHGYTEARRTQQYCGRDADGTASDVIGIPGYHIEVKRTERARLYEWMEQAERDRRPEEIPVILHRQNGKRWLAIMPAEMLLDLIRAAEAKGGEEHGREEDIETGNNDLPDTGSH